MTRLLFVSALVVLGGIARAEELPTVPVGLDAYRQWEKWPQQRIGVRAHMRSTYDRIGRNEGADASHFLYQLRDDFNVTLDVAGHPGILYFARYNHWHGSPWHYVVDGTDHVVQETSTPTPDKPVPDSKFEPAEAFRKPLAWTWSDTKGADLSWVPIGFEKSFTMAYSRTHYGTGYYIYHQFAPGIPMSQPVNAWAGRMPPGADVVFDLVGRPADRLMPEVPLTVMKGTLRLDGPGILRSLTFSIPKGSAAAMSRARLRITWDDRAEPSVDAPLALFFGAGVFSKPIDGDYLVKAFPVSVRYVEDRVLLTCVFPMPYLKSATIELTGDNVRCGTNVEALRDPPGQFAYFHATYKDHGPNPERGKDLVLLDTRDTEGGGDWSGSFVGTSWIFSHNAVLTTLEGDPRFYFDDSQSPQAYGTGTEEWGGGGDYWGGRNMTLPFAGHPCGAPSAKEAANDLDRIQSAYRFLLADLMPFGKNARITLEHGGENESKEHYETVTYWYGAPAPSLVKTDELVIADPESERTHAYSSPQASEPYEIESRYEWGPSNLDGKEIYPAQKKLARRTAGTSEFTLKLNPANHGVLLRRTLDYAYPNQRADVYVADASGDPPDWKPAGVWYLAGSNTCVYSNPREELGATQHVVQTSNRRFRDGEFLIGRDLTKGRDRIRVRVKFTPVNRPLFPGWPLMEHAWTEIRYDAYCYVLPDWKR